MSRRRAAVKREVLPDPKFGDAILTKFMNCLMYEGKKSVAESIVYGAFERIQRRTGQDPIRVFHDALGNVRPAVEVRSRRVGGATYQVPVEVRPDRSQALAIRWLIGSSREPLGKHDGGTALGRIARCREQSGRRRQTAGRHAPDGGREQSVLALSLVTHVPHAGVPRSAQPAERDARSWHNRSGAPD